MPDKFEARNFEDEGVSVPVNGGTEVGAVAVAQVFERSPDGVLSIGANSATRRLPIPARCVAGGCQKRPTELAVVDVLPGAKPTLFFLCEAHGQDGYEALWGHAEEREDDALDAPW
jgi:hypothetical protein